MDWTNDHRFVFIKNLIFGYLSDSCHYTQFYVTIFITFVTFVLVLLPKIIILLYPESM